MCSKGYAPNHDVPYERMRAFVTEKEYRIEVPRERHIIDEMEMFDVVLPTLFSANGWSYWDPSVRVGL